MIKYVSRKNKTAYNKFHEEKYKDKFSLTRVKNKCTCFKKKNQHTLRFYED